MLRLTFRGHLRPARHRPNRHLRQWPTCAISSHIGWTMSQQKQTEFKESTRTIRQKWWTIIRPLCRLAEERRSQWQTEPRPLWSMEPYLRWPMEPYLLRWPMEPRPRWSMVLRLRWLTGLLVQITESFHSSLFTSFQGDQSSLIVSIFIGQSCFVYKLFPMLLFHIERAIRHIAEL